MSMKVYTQVEPQHYIAKLGFTGVYLFSYFFIQNIHCRYSLEMSLRGVSAITFSNKNIKNIENVPMKFSSFTSGENIYILHSQVFVMVINFPESRIDMR